MRKLPYYIVIVFCLAIILFLQHILFSAGMTSDMLPVGEAFGFLIFIAVMISAAVVLRKLFDLIKSRISGKDNKLENE